MDSRLIELQKKFDVIRAKKEELQKLLCALNEQEIDLGGEKHDIENDILAHLGENLSCRRKPCNSSPTGRCVSNRMTDKYAYFICVCCGEKTGTSWGD